MTGEEFVERVVDSGLNERFCIVVITGRMGRDEASQTHIPGVQRVLSKPLDIDELIDAIRCVSPPARPET